MSERSERLEGSGHAAYAARFCARLFAATMAMFLLVWVPTAGAVYISDPSILGPKKAIAQAAASGGNVAAAAEQAQSNAAAKQEVDCRSVEDAVKDAAKRRVELLTPPNHTKALSESTCFIDLAKIKVPVSATGFGFLDDFINQEVQKFMEDTCSKGTDYVNNIKSTALDRVKSSSESLSSALSSLR